MMSYGAGEGKGPMLFDRGFVGDRGTRLLQYLSHAYMGGFREPKNLQGSATDCCMQQFSRGFWTSNGSKKRYLRTFAPKIFPRSDFFQTFTVVT